MELTSFRFLNFFALLLFVYYALPRRIRGWLLLPAGAVFYLAGTWERPWIIVFPLLAVMASFLFARFLPSADLTGKREKLLRRVFLFSELLLLLGMLGYFKYRGLFGFSAAGGSPEILPAGISFYTFILLGYFLDVYLGMRPAETNPVRLLAGGLYFPLLVSGPIVRYADMKQELFTPHPLSYGNLTAGLQRMLWGFFKKLVISARLAHVADAVFDPASTLGGANVLIGAVCFTLQLYTDFSGCMDIVLGLSETLGMTLPENFRTPFFSETVEEFWRRWHITLGLWLRDRLFYPLLRSRLFLWLSERFRALFGKKRGKQVYTWLAMLVLWAAIGLWHGGAWKYVIGTGLLQWCYIVAGECLSPLSKRLTGWSTRRGLGGVLRFLRRLRTFLLLSASFVFFRAASAGQAAELFAALLHPAGARMNTGIGPLTEALSPVEAAVALTGLLLLLAAGILQYRAEQEGKEPSRAVRERIAGWRLPVRWAVWMLLLFGVILLGEYGSGTSAQEFIYRGF